MKVLFDCTALTTWKGHATGIQRVVIELGRELQKILPATKLGLFQTQSTCLEYCLESRSTGAEIKIDPGDLVLSAGSNWDDPEHHARLLSLKKIQVHLGTVFYDTIPALLPFSYGPGFSLIYEKWLKEAIEASAIGFAISENTKLDLFKFAKDNSLCCPETHCFRLGDDLPESEEPVSQEILIKTAEPFLLTVGTIEYRKNHIALLNTYRYMVDALNRTPPKLYIVGKKGWLDQDVEYQIQNDIRLNNKIEVLQGISDADLIYLYKNAMFTLYPSHYEGWGLPVAESLCFGKPCIASASSSMLEIAPGLVRHAHPLLINEWADHICALMDDPSLLLSESEKVRSEYVRWSWQKSAEQIAASLRFKFPLLSESR